MKIINSSAGSGKTTRLIKELSKFKNPLVISFTKASCEDIYKRSGIKALTLHAFCFNFLDSKEIVENIDTIIKIHIGKFPNLSLLSIDQIVSFYNNYSIYQTMDDNIQENIEINKEFIELVSYVNQTLKQYNLITLNNVINLFLENIEKYLYRINLHYDSIFIDEAQDFSELQLEILKILIEEIFIEKFFFIVGDVKQSLYEFQGASVDKYLEFLNTILYICHKMNIPIAIEEKNQTYRFGGQILDHVNNFFKDYPNFTYHISDKKEGIFHEYNGDIETCEILLQDALERYKHEEICVLYKKCLSNIVKLQQILNNGFSLKIYNHVIIDSLEDICYYFITKNNWYAVKILQGPFFNCPEPLLQLGGLIYGKNFLENLWTYKNSVPNILLEYLGKNLYTDDLGVALFKTLYEMSFECTSIFDLIWNLPSVIEIKKKGINFYTVHSSKGLEFPYVLFVNEESENKSAFNVQLKPFSIKNKVNENTNEFNIQYVARTRAIKELIVVNLIKT